MRYSTLIIHLLDLYQNGLKYTVLDQNGIKSHIISRDSTFNYSQLKIGMMYVIRCANEQGVWTWQIAYPLDINQAIK
jgi:hypothetical protein